MMELEFRSQTALVTGAGSGIGRATARRLAAGGASVVVQDLNAHAAQQVAIDIESAGGVAFPQDGDVSDESLAPRLVEATMSRFGSLDILVNNAGMGSAQVPVWEVEVSTFKRDIDINLTSQFMMIRAVVPGMIDRGYGRIINVASAAGMEGHTMAGGYAAAKGGVIAMTKTLGKELATTGIIVNAIAPALIASSMVNEPWFTDDVRNSLLGRIPMGRMGEPEEAAELIAFLASNRVSFSTGAIYDLSGGRATY